jgi:hypothetical protein
MTFKEFVTGLWAKTKLAAAWVWGKLAQWLKPAP